MQACNRTHHCWEAVLNPSGNLTAQTYDTLEVERLTHNEHRAAVSFSVNRSIDDLHLLPRKLSSVTQLQRHKIQMRSLQISGEQHEGALIECDLAFYELPTSWFFAVLARTIADCVRVPYSRTYLYGVRLRASTGLTPLVLFAKNVAKIDLYGPLSVAAQEEVQQLEDLFTQQ